MCSAAVVISAPINSKFGPIPKLLLLRRCRELAPEVLERRLTALQEDNAKKLEQMRATVDEKLHATLEQRLGTSFKLVSERSSTAKS